MHYKMAVRTLYRTHGAGKCYIEILPIAPEVKQQAVAEVSVTQENAS